MKLDPDLIDKEAHKEIRRFLKSTGQNTWERKIAKIDSLPSFRPPSPNAYRSYLGNRNPLTRDIAAFLTIDSEGKLLRKHATEQLMKTCGYLKIINACFSQMSAAVFSRIKSILLDDETVRSFLFELDIATHFFRCGLDVKFADLENLATFDLLVSDGQSELEVECKTKSGDAGRKITRGNFYLLCDVLVAELQPLTESFLILFKCDGRLSSSQQLFHETAREIKRCRANRQNEGALEGLHFDMRSLPSGAEIKTIEDVAAALPPNFSDNGHYFVSKSGNQTLIVGCESTDNDRVLKSMYEDLKRGSDQLSRTRPAILACQLEDIDDEDWSRLRSQSGLSQRTNRLLKSPKRNHVNYVVYSSNKTPTRTEDGITNFSTTNLRFQNVEARYSFPRGFF